MWKKFLITGLSLAFAFGVLFISVLRSAEIRYQFNPGLMPKGPQNIGDLSQIEYNFPYPGGVLPGSPFWQVKILRDKLWYLITTDSGKKSDLLLLFADKRLNTSLLLFEKGMPELGVTTLLKAEQYLVEASEREQLNRARGADTSEFLKRISVASLKHYETVQVILRLAPEDARPVIEKSETYSIQVYEESRDAMNELGINPPINPFVW